MSIGEGGSSSRRRRARQALILLLKKLIAFMFSHVGLCALVIAYTMLGSVLFRSIEAAHERNIHDFVRGSRRKATTEMWKATVRYNVELENWTSIATRQVVEYKEILMKVIRRGYDANDEQDNTQWTFAGAFLYSLTVITTIGYGNIACQTYFGKAMTIAYAILGIPLMLLFLTNVGDVMAKIFRGLYRKSVRLKLQIQVLNKRRKAWQVRRENRAMTARALKQQMRQQKLQAHLLSHPLPSPRLNHGKKRRRHYRDRNDRLALQKISSISHHSAYPNIACSSSQSSLQLQPQQHHHHGSGSSGSKTRASPRSFIAGNNQGLDSQDSFPLTGSTLQQQSSVQATAAAIEQLAVEQMKLETLAQQYEMEGYSLRESTEDKLSKAVVPLWLVFATMMAYLLAGAVTFTVWEDWGFFESFYFCYISLVTVGFGDLFPNKSLKDATSSQEKLTITSLYLLFGMALIAMCFNLAQEEVVRRVTGLAYKLGLIQYSSEAGDSMCETET